MKKIILLILTIAGITGLVDVLRYQPNQANRVTQSSATSTPTVSPPTATPSPTAASQPMTMMSQSSPHMTGFRDGTYTGQTVDVGYGPVQVQVTVKNQRLSAVSFLQAPTDRQQSQEISNYAEPILIQEAIQAQNANVDLVSGATSTSEGYLQSLKNALSQAT